MNLTVTPEFAAAHADELAEVKEDMVETWSRHGRDMVAMNSAAALVRALECVYEFNVADKIAHRARPTLIISGSEDIFTLRYCSEQIHRAIPGHTGRRSS